MADIINITFEDRTKPLTEVGLNKILVLTKSKTVPYKETNDVAGVSELASSDTGYELLEMILAQNKQDVAIFGDTTLAEATIPTIMNKIIGKDFFFIVTDLVADKDITALAKWATAADRILIATPDKETTATQAVALANTINSSNVALYKHLSKEKNIWLNAGITGLMSPKPAGSATWALKSPNLIPKEYFPLADENEMIKGNVNVWAEELGRGITKGGRTTDGSYIDITHGKYWLKNKLRAELSLLLMNRDKVPFTAEGKALILSAIEPVITAGDRQGIIIRDETTIRIPDPLDLLTNDRANRKWNGIEIETRIQGAVESMDVKFILNV